MTESLLTSAYGEWLGRTMPPEKVCGLAAFLMSEESQVTGEIFAAGGGRVARIVLAESEGHVFVDPGAENVRDAIDEIMGETSFFHPRFLPERSAKVSALLGFEG